MSTGHIVLSCKANWSHLRSLCILAARTARSRSFFITFVVASSGNIVNRVTQEISSGGDIKIIGLTPDGGESGVLDDSFTPTWKALWSGKVTTCNYSLKQIEAAPPPSVVILDLGLLKTTSKIIRSEPSFPPIFQWMMAFSGGFLYMCGPSNLGGRHGKPTDVNGHSCEDHVLIPGMPPLTCCELYPQDVGDKQARIQIAEATMTTSAQNADGLLTACAPEYDSKECLDAMANWIAVPQGRRTFHLGPMLPLVPDTRAFSATAIDIEIKTSPNGLGIAVIEFLNKCLLSNGKHSVFYKSFGTEHWPSSLDHVEVLLDTMIAHGYPFILAHAYAPTDVAARLRMKYMGQENSMIISFVPQQAVLSHEACGWFVTHGGANGVMEALTQGIPMIGWPFAVAQPLNIAYITRNLNAGFELTKMRTGKCPTRLEASENIIHDLESWRAEVTNVLSAAHTVIGQTKQKNAVRIGNNLAQAWSEENGRARNDLCSFLDTICKT